MTEHEVRVKVIPDLTEVDQELAKRRAMTSWKCLACITERKGAELGGVELDDLPPLRDAVTVMGGNSVCYEHIQVQRQSPLQLPTNGYGG